MNTDFKVIGLTRLGIKPGSTAQETDAPYHSAIRAWGSIASRVKPMTKKLVFTASLFDVQHLRDSVEKAGKFTSCAVKKGT